MEFRPEQLSVNVEKQELWNKWVLEINNITDNLEHPVDQNIKEPVVALNAFGISTDGSCEGHLNHGLPYPWIDIPVAYAELKNELQSYREIIQNRKYLDEKTIEKDDPILYQKILETRQKYSKKSEEIKNMLNLFLNEFYSQNTSNAPENRIELHESGSGFRLETKDSRGLGLDNWKNFDEKIGKLAPEEKEKLLKSNQTEMKLFGQFLKKKFLEQK